MSSTNLEVEMALRDSASFYYLSPWLPGVLRDGLMPDNIIDANHMIHYLKYPVSRRLLTKRGKEKETDDHLSVTEDEARLPRDQASFGDRDAFPRAHGSNYQQETEASTVHISPQPVLVIVDGLDECESAIAQYHILRSIANVINANLNHLPLRFLITSRPEPHIHSLLQRSSFQHICYGLSLDYIFDLDTVQMLTK
jgi:hypothetical protein